MRVPARKAGGRKREQVCVRVRARGRREGGREETESADDDQEAAVVCAAYKVGVPDLQGTRAAQRQRQREQAHHLESNPGPSLPQLLGQAIDPGAGAGQ